MIKDLDDYIGFLCDIGKTACSENGAERPSQVMTPLQQEMLSGYMLKRLPKEDSFEVFQDKDIATKIADYMISNSTEDGNAVLEAIKKDVVLYFYDHAQNMIDYNVTKRFVEKQYELGLHPRECPQTGDITWTK